MASVRFGLELWVKLAADKPGVIGQLNHFYQLAIRRGAADHQTLVDQLILEGVVEGLDNSSEFLVPALLVRPSDESDTLRRRDVRDLPRRSAHKEEDPVGLREALGDESVHPPRLAGNAPRSRLPHTSGPDVLGRQANEPLVEAFAPLLGDDLELQMGVVQTSRQPVCLDDRDSICYWGPIDPDHPAALRAELGVFHGVCLHLLGRRSPFERRLLLGPSNDADDVLKVRLLQAGDGILSHDAHLCAGDT